MGLTQSAEVEETELLRVQKSGRSSIYLQSLDHPLTTSSCLTRQVSNEMRTEEQMNAKWALVGRKAGEETEAENLGEVGVEDKPNRVRSNRMIPTTSRRERSNGTLLRDPDVTEIPSRRRRFYSEES